MIGKKERALGEVFKMDGVRVKCVASKGNCRSLENNEWCFLLSPHDDRLRRLCVRQACAPTDRSADSAYVCFIQEGDQHCKTADGEVDARVKQLEVENTLLREAINEILQLTPGFRTKRDCDDQEYELEYFEAREVREIVQRVPEGK